MADGLVELTDVAPTLAELAGEPLSWTNGRSLLPILTGEADPARHRDYVRCKYYDALNMYLPQEPRRHTPCWATMYRDERHKLVNYHGLDYGELYDPERDPPELTNFGTIRPRYAPRPPSRASTPRWRRAIQGPIRSAASEPVRHRHGLHGQREHAGREVVAAGGDELVEPKRRLAVV